MGERIKVLDHGYCEYVEHWGSDERIIEAARMSTGKGFLGWGPWHKCKSCGCLWRLIPATLDIGETWSLVEGQVPQVCCDNVPMRLEKVPGDEKLLRYLYTEKPQHSTPFEMAGMVVEIAAPIMVYREWHRHRTQSYNEMSGRYTALPNTNYVPSVDRLLIGSDGKNKQAGTIKGAGVLDEPGAVEFQLRLEKMWIDQEDLYQWALQKGVPKELARVHLGVGRYSRMRASANLLNWLKFLTLRMHAKAQWEIRQFANEVGALIAQKFPRTFALFDESRPR